MIATAGCGLVGTTAPGGSNGGNGSTGGQPATSSQLSSSSTTVSFGNVTVGTPSVQSVTLTDAGTADVVISSVSATGSGFSAGNQSNVTLTPNQSIAVSVTFDPTSTGSATGNLVVTSDASNPSMDIPLSGTGAPKSAASSQLSPSSTTVSFGNVAVGTSTPMPVTLTDMGTADIAITKVSVTGAGFSASGGSNVTLTPNKTVTISVSFDPSASGSAQGTLSISSNASNPTLQVALSGTGVAKTTPTSQLSPNAASLSFGSDAIGVPLPQLVVLSDVGTANVTISKVSTTGSAFSATGGVNVTLTPNQTATITVVFNPTATGTTQGTLSITSTATNSTLTIPLSGTGSTAPAAQHTVALNWQASPSQVIGYFVYRGPSASGLSKLFVSALAATSYVDNTVVNGNTYFYAVTSVDSSNIESSPTGAIAVTVPAN